MTAKGPIGLRVKLQPVYYMRWRLCIVLCSAERQAGEICEYQFFVVVGLTLTRPGFEPESIWP